MTTHNSNTPATPTAESIAHEIHATQRTIRAHHDRKTALAAERAKAVQSADGPAMVAARREYAEIDDHVTAATITLAGLEVKHLDAQLAEATRAATTHEQPLRDALAAADGAKIAFEAAQKGYMLALGAHQGGRRLIESLNQERADAQQRYSAAIASAQAGEPS